jgi:hypothetical protein
MQEPKPTSRNSIVQGYKSTSIDMAPFKTTNLAQGNKVDAAEQEHKTDEKHIDRGDNERLTRRVLWKLDTRYVL